MTSKTAWIGMLIVLASLAASPAALASLRPTARASALCERGSGRVVSQLGNSTTISSNTPSASSPGKYLRVSAQNATVGPGNPAVLALPVQATTVTGLPPATLTALRRQQWRLEAAPRLVGVPVFPREFNLCAFRLRNVATNGCLTASAAHAAAVFVGRCTGSIAQAWWYTVLGQVGSLNFSSGPPRYTLDITNFRNRVGTRLVVASVRNTWNQSWRIEEVPPSLR